MCSLPAARARWCFGSGSLTYSRRRARGAVSLICASRYAARERQKASHEPGLPAHRSQQVGRTVEPLSAVRYTTARQASLRTPATPLRILRHRNSRSADDEPVSSPASLWNKNKGEDTRGWRAGITPAPVFAGLVSEASNAVAPASGAYCLIAREHRRDHAYSAAAAFRRIYRLQRAAPPGCAPTCLGTPASWPARTGSRSVVR